MLQHQTLLGQESDHRLLNGLQMIVSLLSLQGRASGNTEVASQSGVAADRVATIGRIHHRLHSFDGVQTFAIKQYLHDICGDFSTMLSSERPEQIVVVDSDDEAIAASDDENIRCTFALSFGVRGIRSSAIGLSSPVSDRRRRLTLAHGIITFAPLQGAPWRNR